MKKALKEGLQQVNSDLQRAVSGSSHTQGKSQPYVSSGAPPGYPAGSSLGHPPQPSTSYACPPPQSTSAPTQNAGYPPPYPAAIQPQSTAGQYSYPDANPSQYIQPYGAAYSVGAPVPPASSPQVSAPPASAPSSGSTQTEQPHAPLGTPLPINVTGQASTGRVPFELGKPTLLRGKVVNLRDEMAYIKVGSMVAYRGNVSYTRSSSSKQGASKMIMKLMTGEGVTMTEARGTGQVFVADSAKKISIFELGPQETICCNGNDILAFTSSVQWDIKFMKGAGAASGGLTNVSCKGPGMIAICSHGDSVTFRVDPQNPLYTDPDATVAWSGNLTPQWKLDVNLKTIMGRGSGESYHLAFTSKSSGWVIVQPYEECSLDPS